MKQVAEFLRAKASLQITCSNCDHAATLAALYLKARLGLYGNVLEGKYNCTICQSTNVRLSAIHDAARRLRPMQYFGGIYSKHED